MRLSQFIDPGPWLWPRGASRDLLYLLWLGDLAFIILHLCFYRELGMRPVFSLEEDRSYAEFYQYTKELWLACLLLTVAIQRKQWLYYVFALLFVYFFCDDALRIHETLGLWLVETFGIEKAHGFRAADYGELIVVGVIGLGFLFNIGLGCLTADHRNRQVAIQLLGLLFCLFFFGVVADMLHVLLSRIRGFMAIFEDGGEMAVMSFILAYVFQLKRLGPEPD
ncbi:hypothetical protein [Coraliomargarita parva]|uniref:hypothetical protein n=1 Tax=Coraliomargarita parva TaxID=3014050 RepID=UPI0022B3B770|nr:hypothetical protein [Coraliomargarita parva]